jgi:BirA family biotin operon repressor/biotin-[acetyl-CoA-carboxylase] ligase
MSQIYSILLTLADGAWHDSGDFELYSESRQSTLLALLSQLESNGLHLERSDDRRLRWVNPSMPLAVSKIWGGTSALVHRLLNNLEVHFELDSTNHYLRRLGFMSGNVCLAEKQRAGIGRRGRHWHSPLCENIYMSVGWRFDAEPSDLLGLSLGVGIKLAEVMRPYAAVGLKWPNDLYIDKHKLGGVLVELQSLSGGGTGVIIGIGININMSKTRVDIDQAWTSLAQHCKPRENIDRNRLVAQLLEGLLPFLDGFLEQGSDYTLGRWPDFDLAYQQAVTVLSGGKRVTGIGVGIDDQFQFLLRHAKGVSSFSSADVSLRL